jgi:hypothetical protein
MEEPRPRPKLDEVREAMQEHDERADEDSRYDEKSDEHRQSDEGEADP